jgi:SAM-dependent methyltransferase
MRSEKTSKYLYHKLCNICGFSKQNVVYTINEQNLVACQKCGLRYLDKQRADLVALYNEDYYRSGDDSSTANYADYSWQEKVIRKNFHFAYEFIKNQKHNKGKRLLEIGAGFGYFSNYLPAALRYEANEISTLAVKHLKKGKILSYQGDFSDIRLKGKYDYVVAFDVIEHPVDLKKFLVKVAAVLNSDGYFIFTTPDFGSLPNRIFGKRAPTIQPLYHNYYFDKQWLTLNLPSFGFEIISLKTGYITHLSIGQIILLGSFAMQILGSPGLAKLLRKSHLTDKIIPFFRFGGIECIVRKV